MKKIKKYFPLIVGLVILLSVAAYGTRAYFSDSATEEAGIELTLGNVEVTSSNEKSWEYNPEVSASSLNNQLIAKDLEGETLVMEPNKAIEVDKVKIANVRPGDSFSRTFTFKNTGSLATKVTLNQKVTEKAEGPFEITLKTNKPLDPTHSVVLSSEGEEESLDVTFNIKVKTGENMDAYNLPEKSVVLNLLAENITVSSLQAE